jgi:hypothetical protein
MIEMDRRMRGNGDPTSVKPYDPARELQHAHELIAHKITILKRHYLQPALKEFWAAYWHWIISAIAIPLLGFLIKMIAG